jgi:MoxR-like ATPase
MRPIPAPRLGDTHGLLRAISKRERLRLDEFITEFSIEELFPPGLENALGRTRQFVSFARSAGLLKEDRGNVELTEIGKRYVRDTDEEAVFDVSSGQAEWLRRQLFERHMTDSIYHGVAIGLSLFASSPPDFHVSRLDFGRALGHLGRAGWDNENTLESQGERYVTFLRDLELVDEQNQLTEVGAQTKAELTLPVHMSLRDLAGQLNPGGLEAAEAEGEAEWVAATAAAAEPAGEPEEEAQPAEEPASVTAEEEEPEPGPAMDTGEYEDVAGQGAPAAPAAAEPSARPVPPSDVWETAAPDEVTRAYSAISPEQAAAAAFDPAASSVPPPGAEEAPAPGEPVAEAPAAPAEEPVGDEPAVGEPVAVEPEAEEPAAAEPVGDEPAAEEPAATPMTSGDPLAGGVTSGDPLARPTAEEPVGVEGPGVESASPGVAADAEPASAAAEAPMPVVEVPAELVDEGPAEAPTVEEPAPAPEPVGQAPAAPEPAVAAPAAAPARQPSGFIDLGTLRAAAEGSGLWLPDSVYANVIAALASGKHVVIAGPAGSGKTALALAVAKAAVQAGRSEGAALATASPKWGAHDTVGRVGDAGFSQGHVLAAAGKKKWLIVDEIDRAKLDKAFGDLSSFLGGLPLSLPDGSREVSAPKDWRIVATRDTSRGGPDASAALLRRFAEVRLPQPERADLERAIDDAAQGDATAAAAVKRLLADDTSATLGAGVFLDAARHAAERNALSPGTADELDAELRTAYLTPHADEDDD